MRIGPLTTLAALFFSTFVSFGCRTAPPVYADVDDIRVFAGEAEQRLEWGPFQELEALEFSFFDPESNETVAVSGPYRVLYWDHSRVELVGQVAGRPSDARITLSEQEEVFWAHLRLSDREFLTRVR